MKILHPTGIDDRLEQFRPPVVKAEGVTHSERYLSKLAEKSFLNLWSYPNPFRNKKQNGKGDGKELCDLLVVCGNAVIIFSEKTISWSAKEIGVSWRRWVTRAVRDAAAQAGGAERWITEFPGQVFLDRDCSKPFPIEFPHPATRVVHRVIVARGAAEACRDYYPDSSGSFLLRPEIKAEAHWSDTAEPFAIGDVDPSGSFVHVFDEVALEVVMGELDTISDFAAYLERRAALVRSGKLSVVHGEENLLARYTTRIGLDGEHAFISFGEKIPIEVGRGEFANLKSNSQYLTKKSADEISYLWDALITAFTQPMLDGTSIVPEGQEFDLKQQERGIRHMALQNRFARRCHGFAVRDAFEKGKAKDRFFRLMLAEPGAKGADTAFFLLTFKYLDWMEEKGGYEHYRRKRAECAQVYARGILERFPHVQRIIGISREPPDQGRGISEDLVYAEQFNWTDEDRAQIRADCDFCEVLQDGVRELYWHADEFPDAVPSASRNDSGGNGVRMNRKQRRAASAKSRRKR